nr:hypothetical protein [uncultured Acetatifactor sp.]
MDTILYFYRKRGLERPEAEPVGLKAYLLIRIGMDVDEGQWFGRKLGPRPRGAGMEGRADMPEWADQSAGDSKDSRPAEAVGRHGLASALCRPWRAVRQKRDLRKRQRELRAGRLAWEQEEARWLAAREGLIGEMEAMVRGLAREVAEFAQDMDGCRCVYEDSLRKILTGPRDGQAGDRDWERPEGFLPENGLQTGRGGESHPPEGSQTGREGDTRMQEILPALWRKYLPLEEFQGYAQRFWVRQVFSQGAGLPASPPHFVILGTAPGLPEVLEAHARRMKSLRWFLLEAEWGEELSAFVEDFYTEYGLAIELRLLEDGAALKRLRLFCGEPVIVVDFTGESYMAVPAVPEGSVWLDMFSVEEKRRRILARGKDITYFSMKEIWKNAQKRCNCPVLP